MKSFYFLSLLLVLRVSGQPAGAAPGSAGALNRPVLFDAGWKFFRGGVERGFAPETSDSDWRTVDLPHDWSVENLPGRQTPFDVDAISQVGGGFTTGGTGWYRKTFRLPPDSVHRRVCIVFEGVYMNADVWLNGEWLGNHAYGYTGFSFDLTARLRPGETNVLAVQVKNEGQNSRWYAGSGIYRHVWLQFGGETQFAPEPTLITTPAVSAASATLRVTSRYENFGRSADSLSVRYSIVDTRGDTVQRFRSETVAAPAATGGVAAGTTIANPARWSPEQPALYTLISALYLGENLLERRADRFGFRDIAFDPVSGFRLNGVAMKLKGGCYHNDNGPLGAKSFDRAEERRVELMKASGFNAIRCSHNPPPPAFLEACDRLGMLVIDEAFDMWEEGKNPFDYHLYFRDEWKKDVANMITRDINHPSVIMWSIGNEIPNRQKKEVVETGRQIADYVRLLDSTRPVTAAVNDVKEDKDPFFSLLDIGGYNYAFDQYAKDHQRVPARIMMGTESYALEAFDYWMAVEDHPYVIGDFIWTGFDYIGEASIGWRGYPQEKSFFPWTLAWCGDIDICGWKRPQSYYRDALWNRDQLALFVRPPQPSFPLNPHIEPWSKWNWFDAVADWNWPGQETLPLEVTAYSSCETVELLLNGRSLGKKTTGRATRFMATWRVPYRAGTLKAVGYSKGKKVKESVLSTAGPASRATLSVDRGEIRADGQDLTYVTLALVDEKGTLQPKEDLPVHFTIDGPGTIAGLGNADPVSTESFEGTDRKTWRGRCLVVLRAGYTPGEIIVRATAGALPPVTVTITTTKAGDKYQTALPIR